MATFVLVPGGWHGGWAFDDVANIISSEGNTVRALTLAGLGDEASFGVNLSSHIDQVAQAIRTHDEPVVLVAHSYGGMVITGAADRERSHVKALICADAIVPDDGSTVWSLVSPMYRERFLAGAAADGLNCAPPSHLDRRCRPHPMATFLQAISLNGEWLKVPRKAFVVATGWEGSPFGEVYEKLRRDSDWDTHQIACTHDIPQLAPQALARILLEYG